MKALSICFFAVFYGVIASAYNRYAPNLTVDPLAQSTLDVKDKMLQNGFTNVEAISMQEIPSPESPRYRVEFDAVVLRGSGWTENQVSEMISEMGSIYAQCNLQFTNVKIYIGDAPEKRVDWRKFEIDGSDTMSYLRKITPIKNRIIVYFVGRFIGWEDHDASSYAQWSDGIKLRPDLYNTIFLSDYHNSVDFLREISQNTMKLPFSSLAHEMLHVLTLDGGHYNEEDDKNLANIWRTRTNRIKTRECRLIQDNAKTVHALAD